MRPPITLVTFLSPSVMPQGLLDENEGASDAVPGLQSEPVLRAVPGVLPRVGKTTHRLTPQSERANSLSEH